MNLVPLWYHKNKNLLERFNCNGYGKVGPEFTPSDNRALQNPNNRTGDMHLLEN